MSGNCSHRENSFLTWSIKNHQIPGLDSSDENRTLLKGVARDKSMFMHRHSRGVRGHALLEYFDIQYHHSFHFRTFKGIFWRIFYYFTAFAKTKNILLFKCKLSKKNKIKDDWKHSVLHSVYIYYMGEVMVCMMCTLSCYKGKYK